MTKAYTLGRRAYRRGDNLDANPYQGEQWGQDDSRFHDWRDGWRDEQQDSGLAFRLVPNAGWGDRVRIG